MSKVKQKWECVSCGKEYTKKPFGLCSSCGEYDNFQEVSSQETASSFHGLGVARNPGKLKTFSSQKITRISTDIQELDRVLGGGFVPSEVILFAAAPGAGKSTLSLLVSEKLSQKGMKVLYSSGEESEGQIATRAQRMKIDGENIYFMSESSLENLVATIEQMKPDFIVVDSLQTLTSSQVKGLSGSIAQSKECGHVLTSLAKKQGFILLIINQLVKNNDFAGSEAVQHIVDATLMLESDRNSPIKVLRSYKNRFASTTEAGFFQHTDEGIQEVSDPSGVLMDNLLGVVGSSISFSSEGVRQMPIEIQALTVPTELPNPRRQFNGVNWQRAQIVCAILDKYCSTKLYNKDVFVSTISGMKIDDPLCDLSIASSIISSNTNKPSTGKTCFVGELTLTGQVRGAYMMREKVMEAKRLGFTHIILPETARKSVNNYDGITVSFISQVSELHQFFNN